MLGRFYRAVMLSSKIIHLVHFESPNAFWMSMGMGMVSKGMPMRVTWFFFMIWIDSVLSSLENLDLGEKSKRSENQH